MKDVSSTPARCTWAGEDADYIAYHDREWGVPMADDTRLFEKICLEGFQAGLSWLTILKKRENFRKAFAGFDIDKVAAFAQADIERLVADPGIVRHRGKIVSVINNAARAQELRAEFGSLAAYFWGFEPGPDDRPDGFDAQTLNAITSNRTAHLLARDLKKRGWSFVGPTTVYAFMQAMGLVNDHIATCFRRVEIDKARKGFTPPTPRN